MNCIYNYKDGYHTTQKHDLVVRKDLFSALPMCVRRARLMEVNSFLLSKWFFRAAVFSSYLLCIYTLSLILMDPTYPMGSFVKIRKMWACQSTLAPLSSHLPCVLYIGKQYNSMQHSCRKSSQIQVFQLKFTIPSQFSEI